MPEIKIGGKKYVLQEGVTVIGRGKDADIRIDSPKLSRMHARFTVTRDRIEIEDLGSKNSTFVNAKKIEGKHELVKGDQVRIADIECEIIYPESTSPMHSPASKTSKISSSDKAKRGMSRKEKKMIKRIVITACLIAAALFVYSYIKDYIPSEQLNARGLVEGAAAQLSSLKLTDNIGKNVEEKNALEALKGELLQIPAKYRQEYDTARQQIVRIDKKIQEIEKTNSELYTMEDSLAYYTNIVEELDKRTLSYTEAISRLEHFRSMYADADTEITKKVSRKIDEINTLILEQEQNIIKETKAKAKELAGSLKFKEAVLIIDESLSREYIRVPEREVATLDKAKEEIIRKAEEHFAGLANNAVDKARTGDCEQLKEELEKEYRRIGFTEFESKFQEAVSHIAEIKSERIAQVKARMKKELEEIARFEQKRKYEEAAALYEALIPKIVEPEVKKEIQKKKRMNDLHNIAKRSIIRFVNEENGIEVANLGYVKNMNEREVELQIGDKTMPVAWDKIKDIEFLLFLSKAMKKSPNASLYAAYAMLSLNKGDIAEAEEYLLKALSASSTIQTKYPDMFAAIQKLITEREKVDEQERKDLTGKHKEQTGYISFIVEEPAGANRKVWPVTSGVPLAEGVLKDPTHVKLLSGGKELPLQTEVLTRWPDGSIKWLLLDFQMNLQANAKRTFNLVYGARVKRTPVDDPVTIQSSGGSTVISTGPMKLSLSASRFRLFDTVFLDLDRNGTFRADEQVAAGTGIVLTDMQGETYRADQSRAKIKVEQSGPMRVCVRIEGSHSSARGTMFKYIVRIHVYRGQSYVRVFYTFINDWPKALMAKVKSLTLGMGVVGKRDTAVQCTIGTEEGNPYTLKLGEEGGVRLFQIDDRSYKINGTQGGKRAPGWIDLSTRGFGVTACVRDFWQNWPKGLSAQGREFSVDICPSFTKGLYDGKPLEEDNKLYYYLHNGGYTFKIGVARTHEIWFNFHRGGPRLGTLTSFAQSCQYPLLATCDPAYISGTKALGEFPPAHPSKYHGYDATVDRTLAKHEALREKVREYGMLNFGDWYGEREVNWGNLEYDLQHGLLVQYARTGERKYYIRAEQAARHHIDVDVVHAVNSHVQNPYGNPPKKGEIWLHCLNHTGGYYEYGKFNLPVGKSYFMGHSRNWGHVWVGGDLKYYLFSGDRRAFEVGVQIADAMAANCPTPYGTHIRAQGWPMVLLMSAYDVTLDKKYLDAAGKLWRVLKNNLDWEKGWVVVNLHRCYHNPRKCQGNVAYLEGLTLAALSRYHRITRDPEVLKAMTVGVDQMIRECWVEQDKGFRFSACPLSPKHYDAIMLMTEGIAYEIEHTGNKEHLRILKEGLKANLQHGVSGFGKNFAQLIHFSPYGLHVLEK